MLAIIEYIYKFIDKFYFVLRIFLELDSFLTPPHLPLPRKKQNSGISNQFSSVSE